MKSPRTILLAVLGLALIFGRPSLLRSQQESSESERRLAKIREEIKGLKVKIADEEKKEKTMLSALDRIGFTKSLLRNEMVLLNIELDKNQLELEAIKKNIPELRANLDRQKESLARILVTLYKYGRFNFILFVLGSADLNALLGENKNLAVLASSQDRMIAEYAKNLAELGRAEQSLTSKERDIKDLIGKANVKKGEIEAQEKKSRRLINEIKSNIRTYEQTMEEKNIQARQLQELLRKFEKLEPALPFPLVPFPEKKGKLPWPAAGKILQRFGIQRHPQFNTLTLNNGIEIAPPKDDLIVRVVHTGKVVFADYFQGYGNLIIIDHGLTYYSLYGHCAKFLVQKGDIVKTDQPIAEAGDTGSMFDVESLYFEIRYMTKPLDPLQWLRRR
jgi:septal ring factor EnvC (AmiA/AmiB activator)